MSLKNLNKAVNVNVSRWILHQISDDRFPKVRLNFALTVIADESQECLFSHSACEWVSRENTLCSAISKLTLQQLGLQWTEIT